MQTFAIEIGMQMQLTVPDNVYQEARQRAQEADAPEYMRELNKLYPEGGENEADNADKFILGVLTAHIRGKTREFLRHNMAQLGVGGRMSPIAVTQQIPVDPPLLTEAAEQTRPERKRLSEQARTPPRAVLLSGPAATDSGIMP